MEVHFWVPQGMYESQLHLQRKYYAKEFLW